MAETTNEAVEFTPEQQAKVDEIVKSRVAREKEKWDKQSGVDELRQNLEAKDQEIADLKRSHHLENVRWAVVGELARRGVEDEGRVQRILKLVDMESIESGEDGRPTREQVLSQVDGVASDVPELVRGRGAGSGGSRQPILEAEKPLTRDEIEKMSPEEQNRPGMKERIDRFLRGERG
jgi:hypothetical protein